MLESRISVCLRKAVLSPCLQVPEQAKQMATYFAMFYASINMGSMISTIVIPYLR